jgi:predicted PurR-regulated permease PerM
MWLALTGLSIAVLVGLIAGIVWALGVAVRMLSPVLWPLAVAGVLAYLLDPVVDFFERQRISRARAIVGVFTMAMLIIGVVFGSIVPQIVAETRDLADRIPNYTARAEKKIEDWINNPPPLLQKLNEWRRATPTVAPPVTNTVVNPSTDTSTNVSETIMVTATPATNRPPLLGGALNNQALRTASGWIVSILSTLGVWVASWFGILAGIALVPVYTFYFLLEKRGISSRWTDYLPVSDSSFKEELVWALNSINNYLIAFFRGQVLVAICDGLLYGVGFLIIGLPYAVLIGAAAVVLTIIPFLGAITVCLGALIIAAVNFGDWTHPLLVLMVFGIVQTLEGLVISPRIMGGRVGLHPVTIIIAVMAGTTLLGGLLGGILAIPLTATLRVVMFRYVWKRPAVAKDG